MLDVYLTVDVEVWCDGWSELDARFPEAFRRYVYGPTHRGEFGLRFQAQHLASHGLKANFFVEPLFAGRFGLAPLAETVGLLQEQAQHIELHLHTEWLDEWPEHPISVVSDKRQFLSMFTLEQQQLLLHTGRQLLLAAGGPAPQCFRAGSFGFNGDTLTALAALDVPCDASYNATMFGPESGVGAGVLLTDSIVHHGVQEFPMTVYDTGSGQLRHVQLGACSWAEIEALLWQALESQQRAFVMLWHNFELLTPDKMRVDPVVLRRFERLCVFLARHQDSFRVCGFAEAAVPQSVNMPPALGSTRWRSWQRAAEQIYRRVRA